MIRYDRDADGVVTLTMDDPGQSAKPGQPAVKVQQVTDAKEHTIEVRVLVSAQNASAAFDLRCELREKLIAFIQAECPWALPRSRNETVLTGDSNRKPDLLPPRSGGPGLSRPITVAPASMCQCPSTVSASCSGACAGL